MQAVILCGGKGTRLREKTELLPKPLVEIGGQPIVWHVIRWYAHYGVRHFLLACGYKADQMATWVTRASAAGLLPGLTVEALDTGLETPTGGRLDALHERLHERFLCTYADGLSDLRLPDLLATHERAGAVVTLTAIRPRNPFGVLQIEQGRVRAFLEKPLMPDWINGGFFVCEPALLDHLTAESTLERQPLEALAAAGQLAAHQHQGFWACMDTYKDHEALDAHWSSGAAPWRVWEPA
ncbi:MAG: NTP transferase domain-containing protein [Fimbriimonadaceae bacterium]|nr:NTP transferase domain-containing protein [Fimbriimonadaceae bacterium]